jgi:hypothetical protein
LLIFENSPKDKPGLMAVNGLLYNLSQGNGLIGLLPI